MKSAVSQRQVLHLSSLLKSSLIVYELSILFLFWRFEKAGSILTSQSILYMSIMISLLLVMIHFANRNNLPLLLLFAFYLFQKYCLVILLMLLHFEYATGWRFDYFSGFTSDDLNSTLFHGLLGAIAMYGGFLVATFERHNRTITIDPLDDSASASGRRIEPKFVLIVYLAIAFISLSLYLIIGSGRIYIERPDTGFNYLNIFRDALPIFFLTLGVLVFDWFELSFKDRSIYTLVICVIVLQSVFVGSRGMLLTLVTILLFLKTVKDGDFVVRVRSLLYLLAVGVLGVLFFVAATVMRFAATELAFSSQDVRVYFDFFYGSADNPLFVLVYDILFRLSNISPQMNIMNNRALVPPEQYINISNIILDSIDNLVPGRLFPSIVPGTMLYKYVYEGEAQYATENFGVIEYFYLLFGYAFNCIALFLVTYSIGRFWSAFLSKRMLYKQFWVPFFGFVFFTFLAAPGLSLIISDAFRMIIVLVFDLVFIKWVVPFLWEFVSVKSYIGPDFN